MSMDTLMIAALAVVFLTALFGIFLGFRNRGTLNVEQRTIAALESQLAIEQKKVEDLQRQVAILQGELETLKISYRIKEQDYLGLLKELKK